MIRIKLFIIGMGEFQLGWVSSNSPKSIWVESEFHPPDYITNSPRIVWVELEFHPPGCNTNTF